MLSLPDLGYPPKGGYGVLIGGGVLFFQARKGRGIYNVIPQTRRGLGIGALYGSAHIYTITINYLPFHTPTGMGGEYKDKPIKFPQQPRC